MPSAAFVSMVSAAIVWCYGAKQSGYFGGGRSHVPEMKDWDDRDFLDCWYGGFDSFDKDQVMMMH